MVLVLRFLFLVNGVFSQGFISQQLLEIMPIDEVSSVKLSKPIQAIDATASVIDLKFLRNAQDDLLPDPSL